MAKNFSEKACQVFIENDQEIQNPSLEFNSLSYNLLNQFKKDEDVSNSKYPKDSDLESISCMKSQGGPTKSN